MFLLWINLNTQINVETQSKLKNSLYNQGSHNTNLKLAAVLVVIEKRPADINFVSHETGRKQKLVGAKK